MKKYKLLKDLPDAKTGTEFVQNSEIYEYNNDGSWYHSKYVEDNPEWFEEITILIRIPQEAAEFIEDYGCRKEDTYWLPFYFKKHQDCVFELKKMPESL